MNRESCTTSPNLRVSLAPAQDCMAVWHSWGPPPLIADMHSKDSTRYPEIRETLHLSESRNFLEGGYIRDYTGDYSRVG